MLVRLELDIMFSIIVVFFIGNKLLLILNWIGSLLEVEIILLGGVVCSYGSFISLGIEKLMVVFVFWLVLNKIVLSIFLLFW